MFWALEEMGAAEKSVGFISRAEDADPYLRSVRDAVAREAQTYSNAYPEGSGTGLRYNAFERYTKLARQSADRLKAAQGAIIEFRDRLKPLDPTEGQLRGFRQLYDGMPWSDVTEALHAAKIERPAVPAYADFIDHSVTGQEDLLVSFQELFTAPTARHVFSFALAAFIDLIVFLVAFASGPYFFGSSEQGWIAASAALDGLDEQVFVRGFLSKLTPTMARHGSGGTGKVERRRTAVLFGPGGQVTRFGAGRGGEEGLSTGQVDSRNAAGMPDYTRIAAAGLHLIKVRCAAAYLEME